MFDLIRYDISNWYKQRNSIKLERALRKASYEPSQTKSVVNAVADRLTCGGLTTGPFSTVQYNVYLKTKDMPDWNREVIFAALANVHEFDFRVHADEVVKYICRSDARSISFLENAKSPLIRTWLAKAMKAEDPPKKLEESTLTWLADTKDLDILNAIADFPSVPENVLAIIAESVSPYAKAYVADRHDLPQDSPVLLKLLQDNDILVRFRAASNLLISNNLAAPVLAALYRLGGTFYTSVLIEGQGKPFNKPYLIEHFDIRDQVERTAARRNISIEKLI